MTQVIRTPLPVGRITTVMAVACGLAVANLYYCQPLLDLIAADFGVSQGAAALAVTLTQAGYAAGLLFLVPLGDLWENRTLVTRTLILTALALALAGLSPTLPLFLAFSVLIGATSVIAQVLIPLAAHLAPAGQEGAVVGKVMGGLLIGILLARSVAAGVAQLVDWRVIYGLSAIAMVVLSVVLRRMLPERRPEHVATYGQIMASVWHLVRTEPVLRRRALAQASMFGAFTVFWTAITYELVDRHGLSQGAIAVFALVGAAGAIAAPVAGRLADRGMGRAASLVALLLASGSFVLAGLGYHSVVLLALAAIALDFGVQAHQVLGQHVIYLLAPQARARITTAYMTTMFIGGSLASLASLLAYHHDGWRGVCWLGALLPMVGLAAWLKGVRDPRGA
jgi:predicted MFS family arabinose efflux permease